jgi:3-phosphoshikimate 1-carboxyvinyltransferase
LTIHPRLLGGDLWRTYADHRMAQAGALLGLLVPEIVLDDIGCTDKTMPEFEQLWTQMINDSVQESGEAIS